MTSWIKFLFNASVYLSLAVAIGASFSLHITPDYTVASRVSFTKEQFNKFIGLAVPAGIYIGGDHVATCLDSGHVFSFGCAGCGLVLAGGLSVRAALLSPGRRFLGKLRDVLTVVLYMGVAVAMFGISLPSFTAGLDRETYNRVPAVFKHYDR